MKNEVLLEEYQAFVETTWIPEDTPVSEELRIIYGLYGELGEIAELNKKYMRDGGDAFEWRDNFEKELGDVLYYIAKLANFFDVKLDDVLVQNVLKLESRFKRNKIHGSGDNR